MHFFVEIENFASLQKNVPLHDDLFNVHAIHEQNH